MVATKSKSAFVVSNKKGLHTRPSTELVRCAHTFKSNIWLIYNQQCIDAKSILDILTLSANWGAKIQVEAEGEDAERAVEAILNLAMNKFNVLY
ncbi:MAG: ptsH-B [Chlamydiales bacterium]|jgi:phosphocarrier protein|nr:ptsH-B [Chlamydiales bacterium]